MMRMIQRRANTRLNALQCLEAIRHYAATHEGQLPEALSDISDVEIPKDLMSGKAFEYHRTTTGATLQSAIPEGGNERDAVHYEIVVKK
jgi:c-di-GMP-binding flagellar brake protein YcgR